MVNKEIVLRKIPLEDFIDMLLEVHDTGAIFIDIIGGKVKNQDYVGVAVRSTYFSSDVPIKEENTLIDEDYLNQLML